MSITDELRELAKTLTHWWYDPVKDEYTYTTGTMPPSIDAIRMDSNIIAIADRIDTEHESACAAAYGNGVMSVPIALAEHGWVRLPKDTGGEYIQEHDKVDWRDHAGTWHENATVVALCNDGCYVMDGTVFHVHKSDIRHHHAPTVEDVLAEMFAKAIERGELTNGAAQTIAEYAGKLRLAKEDA